MSLIQMMKLLHLELYKDRKDNLHLADIYFPPIYQTSKLHPDCRNPPE